MLAEIRSATIAACLIIVVQTQVLANATVLNESGDCELYLAHSGIPSSGFGVFTTTDIPKDSYIQPFSQGPTVVLNDLSTHQSDGKYPEWILNDYKWQLQVEQWHESESPEMSIPTLGSMMNTYPGANNVEMDDNGKYDDTMASRFTDPGAGAFSYHKTNPFVAQRDIEMGEELFISYDMESHGNKIKTPSLEVYEKVKQTVDKLGGATLTDSFLEKIGDIVKEYDKNVAKLLPKNMDEYAQYTLDSSSMRKEIDRKVMKQRSVDWIKKNGRCLDNLIAKTSTLGPNVGQGAFAQRFISEGDLVVPVPLKQITDKAILDMYELKMVENSIDATSRVRAGSQLLTNYCFGHDGSSMLLCPMTNVRLINHCSDRNVFGGTCDGSGPNAKIEWSSGWDPKSEKWSDMSFTKIKKETAKGNSGLSFDVIATRNIKPGEEVFIDYGISWENAWKEHISSWNPPKLRSKYSSFESITELTKNKNIRTLVEQSENSYSKNIHTACFYFHDQTKPKLPGNWKELSDENLLQNYSVSYHDFALATWRLQKDKSCQILFREVEDDNTTYTVLFSESDDSVDTLIVTNYPEKHIALNMKPYSSDQHLPNAFRHPIGIPSEIFPVGWENL